jgi:Putative DNA-binding domain
VSERLLRARHVLRSLRAWRRRLLTIGFLVVALFAGVGLVQHEYVHTSFLRSVDRELAGWASEVNTEVAYKDRWDLADYRERASVFAPRWWIIARNGLVVDITGLAPNIFKHVQLVGEAKLGSPTTVVTSIGEPWRIPGKNIDGGVAVVGIASPKDLTKADAKLDEALDKFGTSLAEAAAVRERQTDQEVDFAVITAGGSLVNASGGVPFMTDVSDMPVALDTESATTIKDGDRSYRLLSLPIRGTNGQTVGAILVPKDITGELQALADQDRFNIVLVIGSLAFLVLVAFGFAARELWRRRETPTVEEALKVGESKTVEFKSTYQWDPDKGVALPDKRLVILKAITGFLNADGGTLYIGVGEDRSTKRPYVCGLEKDLDIVSGNLDKLRRDLVQLIGSRVGSEFAPCIADSVETVGNNVCWIVSVQRGPKPAWVHWLELTKFYVREGPRTADLNNESTYNYIKNRWG